MKKNFTRFLLLLLALTLLGAMLAGGAMAASNKLKKKTIVVTTQEELVAALKKYGSSSSKVKIKIETNEKATFTISAKYSSDSIQIEVDAPNATIKSKAKVSSITINEAKSVKEYASGNKITIYDEKVTFTAMENANVEKVTVSSESGDIKILNNGNIEKVSFKGDVTADIENNGSCGRVYISAAVELHISGTAEEALKVTVEKDAMGTKIIPEVPVKVNVYANQVEMKMKAGADSSTVTLKDAVTDFMLKNEAGINVSFKATDYSISYILNNPDAFLTDRNPVLYADRRYRNGRVYLPAPGYKGSDDTGTEEDDVPEFLGWYDAETFEGPIDYIPDDCQGNRTFFAMWDMGESHVHAYTVETKRAATCTEDGLIIKTCSCGAFEITRPKAGHKAVLVPGKAATCTETGLTDGRKCSVCGAVLEKNTEIPALEHEAVADPGKEATCMETGLTEGSHCSVCGTVLVAQQEIPLADHTAEAVPGKAATCLETGLTEGSRCGLCGAVLVAQQEIPLADHTAGEPQQENPKAATCTEPGSYESVVYCTVCGGELSRTEVKTDPVGHAWGEAVYTWNEDHSACTAAHVCTKDAAHTESETVTAGTEITQAAGCETAGKAVRTAAFTNTAFEKQAAEITLAAAGHTFSEVNYSWNGDYTACTATRTCTKDASHVESETSTARTEITLAAGCETAGKETRAAAFTNPAFETQKAEVVLEATGHAWGKVDYSWNGDYSACTAKRVCTKDAAHTESETVTADTQETIPAGCETTGKANRVADFTNQAFETQTAEITLAAKGHAWPSEPTWKWDDEMTRAEATLACGNDPTNHFVQDTDTQIVCVNVTDPDPAGNTSGKVKFTAAVTLNGTQYTCEKEKTYKWAPTIKLDPALSTPQFPQEGQMVLDFIEDSFPPTVEYNGSNVEGSFEYTGSGLYDTCGKHAGETLRVTVTFTPKQGNVYDTVSDTFTLTFQQ